MKTQPRYHICPILVLILITGLTGAGEDWPTYRHDMGRSGVTADELPADLAQEWCFVPGSGPEVAWPDPNKEMPRMMFDEVFHVAVADGAVYFGSSSDSLVYALDAATGEVKWTAYTGGPVRCAPMVVDGKVYVGSDDGCAYCFRATNGDLVWRFQAGFAPRKVAGNGKMISLWPVRTGVLVDGDVAYFGAGIFPHESTFVYALDARTGRELWCNDTCGQEGYALEFGGMTPQGYLLATKEKLYVPSGRAMPGVFNRADGDFVTFCSPSGKVGGTWGLIDGDSVVSGMETKKVYGGDHPRPGDAEYVWFPGYELVVTEKTSYLLDAKELRALDREAYAYAGQWRTSVIGERNKLTKEMEALRRERMKADDARRDAIDARLREIVAETESLNAQQDKIEEGVHRWRQKVSHHNAMILAGKTILVGGDDAVAAIHAVTGQPLWTKAVDGRAAGLAVANGRLYVSTDTGAIHCFGNGGTDRGTVRMAVSDTPFPADDSAVLYAEAADAIVAQAGTQDGFCLVYGSEDGRLAYELAQRTPWRIIGVDPDGAKVAAAREALLKAGLQNRVRFEEGDLMALPHADYFANVIVSDTLLRTGQPVGDAREIGRLLKPCGGVAVLGGPSSDVQALAAWLKGAAGASGVAEPEEQGSFVCVARGPLEDMGKWTHQYADAANTACSDELRVRGPLGVLWFGEPGPKWMVERHARAVAPVAMDGRLFMQGEHVVLAYDAYNGVKLWERDIKGAVRVRVDSDMGNLALAGEGLFVAAHDACYRLDPATGATLNTYPVPKPADEPRRWGYIACAEGLLFGSSGKPLDQDYGEFWDLYVSDEGTWQNIDDMPARYRQYVQDQHPEPDQEAYWASQQGGLLWREMSPWPAWGSVEHPDGAVTSQIMGSDLLFALEPETGNLRWQYEGKLIAHPAIAVADGTVFFADCDVSEEEKAAAIEAKKACLAQGIWEEGGEMKFEPRHADVRRLVALDAATGEKRWERIIDLTGCGGDRMGLAYKNGILLAFGCFSNHDRQLFRENKLTWRRITAVDGQTGGDIWSKPLNYLRRPLIIKDDILIEPRRCALETGDIRMREHPLTGQAETWEFVRPGHCCSITSACPNMFFLRGYFLWYYDMEKDDGMLPFGGIRPGCWINTIPANGLLLFPEASAGCGCAYPVRCSLAMQPKEKETTWSILIQHGAMTPVEHMAVNLGAPGDWRDENGTLWFGYPHPRGNSFFSYGTNFGLNERFLEGMDFYRRNFQGQRIANSDAPWLFASGAKGLTQCVLPLREEGQGSGRYAVRLYFCDPENDAPGQRVFDVRLQDRTVARDVDIVAEAGGGQAALIKEFDGIEVEKELVLELVAKTNNPAPHEAPVLNAIEVVCADRTLAQLPQPK